MCSDYFNSELIVVETRYLQIEYKHVVETFHLLQTAAVVLP